MSRFATGILTLLGAILALLVFNLISSVLAMLSAFAEGFFSSLLPSVNQYLFICLFVLTYSAILYSLCAWPTDRFIRFYCNRLPRVNEYAIRVWLLFCIALTLFGSGADGINAIIVCYVIGCGLPSYLILRYRPLESEQQKQDYQQSKTPSSATASSPDHEDPPLGSSNSTSIPQTLRRSANLRK